MGLLPEEVRTAAQQSADCRDALLYIAQKVLHNIRRCPDDIRYRRLNTEAKAFTTTLAPHAVCQKLLQDCGFLQEGNHLVLNQPDLEHLAQLQEAIEISLGVDAASGTTPEFQWMPAAKGVPPFAVIGGHEANGSLLFVARGWHGGGLHPGKSDGYGCCIAYGGKEVVLQDFEILQCSAVPAGMRLKWKNGLQQDAVIGGQEGNGTPLYVARMPHQGGLHPGKAGAHLRTQFSAGWGGLEVEKRDFQTLVLAPEEEEDGELAEIGDDMTRPCAHPLRSLAELLQWKAGEDTFNVASIPLPPLSTNARRKVLVCHDMQGGYCLGDKYIQGVDTEDAYTFQHWELCDIFVYFSHHRVTIPPPCWINCGHRHGVQVLGTFITEWDEGAAECKDLLSSSDRCEMYCDRLVEIAAYYRFDGWLINIENQVPEELMPMLLHMCEYLTRRMHETIPHCKVIWYDSVVYPEGKLIWQNCLNDHNIPFFAVTDGIFLNYHWKANQPALSAEMAQDRRHDVYVGIDVHGRGTFGGGKYNCGDALDVIKRADCSVALFAPAWTFETEAEGNRRRFEVADETFWLLWQQRAFLEPRPQICHLPFLTNFNKGCGSTQYVDGQLAWAAPWCHIDQLDAPPLPMPLASSPGSTVTCAITADCPFNGGSSLAISGALPVGGFAAYRLLTASITLPLTTAISFVFQSDGWPFLPLLFMDNGSERLTALLYTTDTVDPALQSLPFLHLKPAAKASTGQWSRWTYRLDVPSTNWRLFSIAVICGDAACFFTSRSSTAGDKLDDEDVPKAGRLILGEVKLLDGPPPSFSSVPLATNVRLCDITRNVHPTPNTISVTLQWDCHDTVAYSNVYLNHMLQGRAYCHQYRLCDIPVNSCFEVQIQLVLPSGIKRPLCDVPLVPLAL